MGDPHIKRELAPHLSDGLVHLLLVGIHFDEGADLSQVDVFTVAQSDDLVKGKYQIEGIFADFGFFEGAAVLWNLID